MQQTKKLGIHLTILGSPESSGYPAWSILVASAVRADVGFERAEWDPELSSFLVNVTGNNEDFDKVREAFRQASSWKVYFRGDGVGFESLTVKNQTRTVFFKIDALGSFMIPHPKELTRIFNLMYKLQTIQRPSASLLIGARAR